MKTLQMSHQPYVDLWLLKEYFNNKQWRPRWNAAWRGISSGSAPFAEVKTISSDLDQFWPVPP